MSEDRSTKEELGRMYTDLKASVGIGPRTSFPGGLLRAAPTPPPMIYSAAGRHFLQYLKEARGRLKGEMREIGHVGNGIPNFTQIPARQRWVLAPIRLCRDISYVYVANTPGPRAPAWGGKC